MKIPVFVSSPTDLTPGQEASRSRIVDQLTSFDLEPRSLGRSDYPTEYPLREVAVIAKHCAGGVVLGFTQFRLGDAVSKPDTGKQTALPSGTVMPTPWNHLEAGILFGLGLPLLIFKEPGISGGVFDNGVTDVFVHQMPEGPAADDNNNPLRSIFLKWQAEVRETYYRA